MHLLCFVGQKMADDSIKVNGYAHDIDTKNKISSVGKVNGSNEVSL